MSRLLFVFFSALPLSYAAAVTSVDARAYIRAFPATGFLDLNTRFPAEAHCASSGTSSAACSQSETSYPTSGGAGWIAPHVSASATAAFGSLALWGDLATGYSNNIVSSGGNALMCDIRASSTDTLFVAGGVGSGSLRLTVQAEDQTQWNLGWSFNRFALSVNGTTWTDHISAEMRRSTAMVQTFPIASFSDPIRMEITGLVHGSLNNPDAGYLHAGAALQFTQLEFLDSNGNLLNSSYTVVPDQLTPEPSTALAGVALVLLAALRTRLRRA